MATLYANNIAGTLAANIGPSDTQILLGAGQGASFPSPSGGDYFYATLVHNTTGDVEIVKCTARSIDTLTVERGRDGTAAISFTTGAVIELRLCRIILQELDYRLAMGVADGLATLDAGGKIPDAQIPASIARDSEIAAAYVPLTQRGAVNGVATLDAGAKIPDVQIPDGIARDSEVAAAYVPLTQRAAANGVATLDATTKVPVAQIPDLSATYLTKANPVATGNLSVGGTVTAAQDYKSSTTSVVLATSAAGTVYLRPNGAASATNQVTLAGATGVLTAVDLKSSSDRRIKKCVRREVARPHLADALQLCSWRFKETNHPGRGVIAQQVQGFAPEYVGSSDGILSIDKAGLALEAVLGLAARVRQLEKPCSPSKRLTSRSNSSPAQTSRVGKSRRSSG